jgi:peptidoglycan/LPS O-acetylase OafA/YrhL
MSPSNQPNTTRARGEIFELTGLRGVAALMVALLHLNFDIAGGFGDIYDESTFSSFSADSSSPTDTTTSRDFGPAPI